MNPEKNAQRKAVLAVEREEKKVKDALERYLKYVCDVSENKIEEVEWEEKNGGIDFGNFVETLDKFKQDETFLILILLEDVKMEWGVRLVKRLRYLYPWGRIKEEKKGDRVEEYFLYYPIIFLSLDRVWLFEEAAERIRFMGGSLENEEELGKHFLPTLKNLYCLKIPEELSKLKKIIQESVPIKLKLSRQEAEGAFLAYDEHGGGHG